MRGEAARDLLAPGRQRLGEQRHRRPPQRRPLAIGQRQQRVRQPASIDDRAAVGQVVETAGHGHEA